MEIQSLDLADILVKWINKDILTAISIINDGVLIALATKRGSRSNNQDRLVAVNFVRKAYKLPLNIVIIADGMGGMKEGNEAASISVASIISYCIKNEHSRLAKLLEEAINFANYEVYKRFNGKGGAAVVSVAWIGEECYIGHVGDTRAYGIKDDLTMIQLTTDDTIAGQLQLIGQEPLIMESLQRQLVQYIGIGTSIDSHIEKCPGELRGLILTTDGVHNLPIEMMQFIVKNSKDMSKITERLVTAGTWFEKSDNASAAFINFGEELKRSKQTFFPVEILKLWNPKEALTILSSQVISSSKDYTPKENNEGSLSKKRKTNDRRSQLGKPQSHYDSDLRKPEKLLVRLVDESSESIESEMPHGGNEVFGIVTSVQIDPEKSDNTFQEAKTELGENLNLKKPLTDGLANESEIASDVKTQGEDAK